MRISVMLVDDEPLALENLYETVPWQDYRFEVVARATNGKMALRMFEQLRPHIVITDISMSPMDGLELGSRVREIRPETHLIFLTAYRDFDYVRHALDLKAAHYLLKHEISRNRLLEQLIKLREHIEAEQTAERQENRRWFRELLCGNLDEQSEKREAGRLLPCAASLLYFELNPCLRLDGRRETDRFDDPSVWDAVADEMMQEEGTGIKEILLLETGDGGCAAVIQFSIPNSLLIKQYTLQKISLTLQRCMLDRAGEAPKILMSAVLERENVHRQYERIKHLYTYAFFLPDRSIFLLEQALGSTETSAELESEWMDPAENEREKTDTEMLDGWRKNLDGILANKSIDGLLFTVKRTGERWTQAGIGKPDMPLGCDAHHIVDTLYRMAEDRAKNNRQQSQYSRWVLKAMEYVHEHYGDTELSLETAAEHLQISAVHLRMTFKKETGRSLLDYTTEYRIEAAKRLLLTEKLKIYEVSEKVGYRTSQYFSQVFKKATGLHPKDFVRTETGR
ncbi:response regulator transcription factor [Paenibacillus lemnae]|uniref:Response regulator n=1 Tax=Paenibacillus lemnae TaxID=1330551 RepID=A0A848M332_PAELE|nr:response regulator [Paenibacillus lemnae]NMO94976.1 response regulator [Paenibacillus lemnae]